MDVDEGILYKDSDNLEKHLAKEYTSLQSKDPSHPFSWSWSCSPVQHTNILDTANKTQHSKPYNQSPKKTHTAARTSSKSSLALAEFKLVYRGPTEGYKATITDAV